MHDFWKGWPRELRQAVWDRWQVLDQDNAGRRYYLAIPVSPDGLANALYAEEHNLPLAVTSDDKHERLRAPQRLTPNRPEQFFAPLRAYFDREQLRDWMVYWDDDVDLADALGLVDSVVTAPAPAPVTRLRQPVPLSADLRRVLGRLEGRITDEIALLDGYLIQTYGTVPERNPRAADTDAAPPDVLRRALVDAAFSLEAVRDVVGCALAYANSALLNPQRSA